MTCCSSEELSVDSVNVVEELEKGGEYESLSIDGIAINGGIYATEETKSIGRGIGGGNVNRMGI